MKSSESDLEFFTTPADLVAKVALALVRFGRLEQPRASLEGVLPSPPQPYVSQPYLQLTGEQFVGRQRELDRLSEWAVASRTDAVGTSLLVVRGISGVGKSALAWRWFWEEAANLARPLAGRFWWSFAEDKSFDEFIV